MCVYMCVHVCVQLLVYICVQIYKVFGHYIYRCYVSNAYGVATISRLLKIIGLFCKRAL